jgi:transposase
VRRWARAAPEHGEKPLDAASRAGYKPLLDGKQGERLIAQLLEGPEKLGSETALWTCDRVGHLIHEEFGVRYHSGQCGRSCGN